MRASASALFYSGVPAWAGAAALGRWPFSAFSAGDALIAGFALEIVPTRYRATVSGLRYLVEIGAARSRWRWKAGSMTISTAMAPPSRLLLVAIPITLIAILFLPEPAGKTLEEMAA